MEERHTIRRAKAPGASASQPNARTRTKVRGGGGPNGTKFSKALYAPCRLVPNAPGVVCVRVCMRSSIRNDS
jgi:hypothetical protein